MKNDTTLASHTAVTDFLGSAVTSQAAAACKQPTGRNPEKLVGTKSIPLAAWTGARIGLAPR